MDTLHNQLMWYDVVSGCKSLVSLLLCTAIAFEVFPLFYVREKNGHQKYYIEIS